MIRVAHLITGLEVGGTETMLYETLSRLRTAELEHRVYCIMGHGPIGQAIEKLDIPVVYLAHRHWWHISRTVVRLWRSLHQSQADILVTYLIHADLLGRFVGRWSGIKKIIAYKHGALLQWEWLKYLEMWTRRRVTQYVAVSQVLQRKLVTEMHVPAEKIEVISNGIDLIPYQAPSTRDAMRAQLGVTDHVVLGIVAALRQGKGHLDLLHSLAAVRHTFPNKKFSLLVAGTGSELSAIEAEIRTLELGNSVQILGYRQDIPELLRAMDIFVLPTYFEGMSVAILQAMAAATPIVTTSIPENLELVHHEESALLVTPGDRIALTAAISRLVEDPMLGQRLAGQARSAVIDQYDILKTVARFRHLLVNA